MNVDVRVAPFTINAYGFASWIEASLGGWTMDHNATAWEGTGR